MSKKRTEADLEARLHAVLKLAFPWWDPGSISHQERFTVRLGRAEIGIDGTRKLAAVGRADIVVSMGGKHLAVVELKREGSQLSPEDAAQGLSYARLLEPMAPLVIVSNGTDTHFYISYTGERWVPNDRTEAELQTRFSAVGVLASSELQKSIEVLMGSEADHWVSVVQAVSNQLVLDRSADWGDPFAPFVKGFLIPRRASGKVILAVNSGKRVVVIHGPPLSGKSNVLRELVEKADKADGIAVLLVEPSQTGVFAALANLLSSELAWKVTVEDAREWLRRVSNATKAQLVLAIDGVDPSHQIVVADLEELATARFGSQLSLVVALDDSVLDAVVQKSNRREKTTLGRGAVEVALRPLDDGEFEIATGVLGRNRIGITPGGESVRSLREPWALRLLVPNEITEFPADNPELIVRLPPLIDLNAINEAAEAFSGDAELVAAVTRTSRAVLAHYLAARKAEAVLQGLGTFSVAQNILERELGQRGIEALHGRGFLKAGVDWSGDAVWFVRVPTLMAAHVAIALADEMSSWGADQDAQKLMTVASKLPFGEVIAAQAIAHRIKNRASGTVTLIEALLAKEPTSQPMMPGTKFAFAMQDKVCEATLLEAGKLAIQVDGRTQVIEWDQSEEPSGMYDLGGWLILSHLATLPLGLQTSDMKTTAMIDEVLLERIGRAKFVLSGPEGGQDFRGVVVHDVQGHGSVVCHKSGIVEPITWALMQFFLRRGTSATEWVSEVSKSKSLPLLTRIHIALVQVASVADARGGWAKEMLTIHVVPAMRDLPMFH